VVSLSFLEDARLHHHHLIVATMPNNEELDNEVRKAIQPHGESVESLSDGITATALSLVLRAYVGDENDYTSLIERLSTRKTFKMLLWSALHKHDFDYLGDIRKLASFR
jgi:hypothetical protein